MSDLFLYNPDYLPQYLQDNLTGFPVTSTTSTEEIYKSNTPQKIIAFEQITAGDLLNTFYSNGSLVVQRANALDKAKYANSLALTSGAIGSLITCAVKVGTLPSSKPSGSYYLHASPGGMTNTTLGANAKILQKVGEVIDGHFYFFFHTPIEI